MRVLPDQPNLHFLKEEAKELLLGLREDDPRATLTQAHRLLAGQYGFVDWAALAAAVETRRAQTVAASPSLAHSIALAFGLGEPVAPMTGVTYAYGGRTWTLETGTGRFFVFPVFDWVDEAQASRAVDLSRAAAADSVSAPVAVHDPEGRLVHRVDGQNWRVDEWMDLGPTPQPPYREALANQAGRILATIHRLHLQAPGPMGPWLTCRRPMQAWTDLAQELRQANVAWSASFDATLPAIQELSNVPLVDPPSEPILSICDLNPAGVRVGPSNRLTVVHWDYAGPHVPEWELAYTLYHWAIMGGDNYRCGKALNDGYADVTGAKPELDITSFAPAICGHLNWLYNQAHTALFELDEETRTFADRELNHLTTSPLTAARIEALLRAIAD
jgi:hypothetical protein